MLDIPRKQLSPHSKGYRVCVGQHRGADGKVRPRTFWLGHDPVTAHYAAQEYQAGWSSLQFRNISLWTDDEIRSIQASVKRFEAVRREARENVAKRIENLEARKQGLLALSQDLARTFGPSLEELPQPPPAPHLHRKEVSPLTPTPATLYAAIERYLEVLKDKRRSDSHKARADRMLNLNLKRAARDCPLSDVDYLWIDRLCDHFKSRPPGHKNGRQIAATTVATTLRYFRAFFTWIDDTGFGGWEAPRKYAKPFRCNVRDLMTPAELKASGSIKQFDHGTLRKLYVVASDSQKCLMLMGLFTGATQQELSVLEKSEFDLPSAQLIHFRNKTKVEGRFWLPPELVALLRSHFAARPRDPLAFRTADGNALVTFRDGRQVSDSVRQTWDDLRRAAKVPDALSFKYLRKYLGDWMTRHGGESVGQVALCHSPQTILARNYTSSRDFDAFMKLQRTLHSELRNSKVL